MDWFISYVIEEIKWINKDIYMPINTFKSTVSQDHPFTWLSLFGKVAASTGKRVSLISFCEIDRDDYNLFAEALKEVG